MTTSDKDWWARVWRGLVVDPGGKHVRRLKGAFPLLIYLILHANFETGRLRQTYGTIAREMGLSPWTIRAWMRRLEFYDYVRLTKTGRAMLIEVLKWRPVGHGAAPRTGTSMPVRAAGMPPQPSGDRPGSEERRGQNAGTSVPNISTVTRDLERDNGVKKFSISNFEVERSNEEERARAELLAQDLAAGLDDPDRLSHYLTYAHRVPESLLRRLLSEARAVPAHTIKRSRAALFEYLLKQHVVSTNLFAPDDSRA